MTRFYPVFLHLEGRSCIVIGNGPVAEQKVIGLLGAGAHVTVVSPDPPPRLRELAADGAIELRQRGYEPGDLDGAFLAIVSVDDRAARHTVWQDAERQRVLINAVDDLPHCSFIAPSTYQQGDLAVAVSTAGKSPALAVCVRNRIGALLGPEYGTLLTWLGDLRADVAARIPDTPARTALWYRIVDSDAIEFIQRGDLPGARRRLDQLIHDAEAATSAPRPSRAAAPPVSTESGS
jgi:siroheme synthase-like protein